jgi:hypothetical protein
MNIVDHSRLRRSYPSASNADEVPLGFPADEGGARCAGNGPWNLLAACISFPSMSDQEGEDKAALLSAVHSESELGKAAYALGQF